MLELLLKILRTFLRSPILKKKSRKNPKDFTRDRKMTFYDHLVFGLSHFRGTLSYEMYQFFGIEDDETTHMAEPSYSKARKKFSFYPYQRTFEICRNFILNKSLLKTYRGYHLIAIDGSSIGLPNLKSLERYGRIGRKCAPAIRMSLAAEVLSKSAIDIEFAPYRIGERELALQQIQRIIRILDPKKIIFIFDRGYPSRETIRFLESVGAKYIFRVSTQFHREITSRPLGESVLTLEEDLNTILIRLMLRTGETENLITNLETSIRREAGFLYSLRWAIEVCIRYLKSSLRLEDFNGYLINSILQDLWIVSTIYEIMIVIHDEGNQRVRKEHAGENLKYRYEINFNEAVGALHWLLPKFLLEENPEKRKQHIDTYMDYVCSHVIPKRKRVSRPRTTINRRYKINQGEN